MNNYSKTHYVPIDFNEKYLEMRENQKHNVIVGVMDTGIGLGVNGLTQCPDGKPKIIDTIDCTGADDIILNKVMEFKEINKFHQILKKIDNSYNSHNCYIGKRSLRSFVSKRVFREFDAEIKNLIDQITFDVIVYQNDQNYCIIDYDGGNEDNWIKLKEYHISQEYGTIPLNNNLSMTFAFHLYDHIDCNKKICSLVFESAGHGTHVAGIIGASFDDPMKKMNGINPWCQFISLKISDYRVDGMETSISLIRGLHELVKYGCHIVNFSYGEPLENCTGRFFDILNEFVYKYNITFITSAGNSGPGFTTLGAPGSATDRVITIGGYADKKYLDLIYFLSDNGFKEGMFHWSSCGPANDQGMGISMIAPGCALTTFPRWHPCDLKMCNGTSMSAPNACGFLTLILGQFENSDSYPHTFWLKKYMESTCTRIHGLKSMEQGHGLYGQIYVDLNYFNHNIKYWYDTNIKGVIYHIDVNDIDEKEMNFFNLNISLISLHNDFNIKKAIHSIIINYDDINLEHLTPSNVNSNPNPNQIPNLNPNPNPNLNSNPNPNPNANLNLNLNLNPNQNSIPKLKVIGPREVLVHQGSMLIRIGVSKKFQISGYIKLYESETQRLIQNIAINQFLFRSIGRNDEMIVAVQDIAQGKILRKYFIPKCNAIKFTLTGKVKYKVAVDIIQLYSGKGHDKRLISKKITPNIPHTFMHNLIPGQLTEICLYIPWNACEKEYVGYIIEGTQKDIFLNKHQFEINECLEININRYYDQSENIGFKSMIELNSVETKYYPIKAELLEPDSRYNDKNGKRLKLLRLTYVINNHPKCSYHIETNNKIYDSILYMSGCIHGYKNNRKIFFSNYTAINTIEESVDMIQIEFMDSDIDLLKNCLCQSLYATRKIQTKKIQDIEIKKGIIFVPLISKNFANDVTKINNVYEGDQLQYSILGEKFSITHRNVINIEYHDGFLSKNEEQIIIQKHMKEFNYVKLFFNKVAKRVIFHDTFDETNDETKIIINKGLSLMHINKFSKKNYKSLIYMNPNDRIIYEYIGTIMYEFNPGIIGTKSIKLKKDKFEKLHDDNENVGSQKDDSENYDSENYDSDNSDSDIQYSDNSDSENKDSDITDSENKDSDITDSENHQRDNQDTNDSKSIEKNKKNGKNVIFRNRKLYERLKITCEHLEEVLKTVPYCVIEIGYKMKDNNLNDIDNKMKIISNMESKLNYWNNGSYDSLDLLRKYLIDNIDHKDNYTENEKQKILSLKRKCALMIETNEKVF